MPLLKKMVFKKASVPENLRDDEEVFHCVITNEIFRDYEEFSQRIILCNSMVWTCCMTGKTNLTYAEAEESEENARKSLKYFSPELRVPILYLATLTQRTSFADMSEDVFLYAKDRYFIGENVDALFSGSKWKEYQVQQVIAPTEAEIKCSLRNGDAANHSNPPPSLYRYGLLQLSSEDKDVSEMMILDANQIRRRKGLYSREKNKLFLKQYAIQNDLGVWVINDSILEEFGIKKVKFSNIFGGLPPKFEVSKKIKSAAFNGKKVKQETLAKFLSKNNVLEGNKKNSLVEQLREREEKFKLMKQKIAEEKVAERQRRKEENIKVATYLRDWYKPKEDLELEDHKKLPEFTPVISKVPAKYFGDVLMITEFVHTFSSLLQTKKYFSNGLTLELMERALTEKEVAGPLMDVIHMLLVALFNVQEAEASQYKTHLESSTDVKENKSSEQVSLTEATKLATVASKYSNAHLGTPLNQLPLYTLTISEVLRLHLLSSGARINDTGARWRYQERGGYTSEDDPGLYLRIHEPHIIKALALRNIVELPIGYKIKIVSCLINQLLTYADVRDVVEERLEVARQAKIDLRVAQMAERKREAEFVATRLKIKREAKANSNENVEKELEKLARDAESKQFENQKKIQELMKKSLSDNPVLLGYDRAFRRYLKIDSVPGFFVNSEDNQAGVCLEKPVVQKPELINVDRTEIIKYIRSKYLENDESNKHSSKKVNGVKTEHDTNYEELMICNSDASTCPVHSTNVLKTKWNFIYKEEQLDELINSLNKRGIRESELEQVLQNYRENINKTINKTPYAYLNPDLQQPEDTEQQKNNSKQKKSKYKDTNLGYPSDMDPEEVYHAALTDILLEMEEKIHTNYLGSLKIKDRDTWRDCLNKRNYDEFLSKFNTVINGKCVDLQKNGDDKSRSSSPEIPLKTNIDPGLHLGPTTEIKTSDSDTEDKNFLEQPENLKKAIQCLAIALNQIAHGVLSDNLKKPLGNIGIKKDKRKGDMLPMWEQSLLNSTSFSQIFLHYGTLDSCIKWSKSASKAKCQICRRLIDAENMLLCDSCNNGHHLYCLKPELKSVPSGKWYCDKCKIEMGIEKEEIQPPRAAKKKRKLFVIDDEDEDEDDGGYTSPVEENGDDADSEVTSDEESDYENGDEDDDDEEMSDEESIDEDAINGNIKEELCHMCGSGGELLNCKGCMDHYHIECVEPPLKRAPRGPWFCNACKEKEIRKSKRDKRHINGDKPQRSGRFCAARALHKIQDYTKSLQYMSESDDSDEPRRARYEDFPLHNSALQELLSDVMKHDDAWPFIRPVNKTEVPDYYDVISKPMDFGTIKYKLNMGNYKEDAELMDDVVLVFDNCNTYNNSEALVYKCGQRLLKFFKKKCQSLNLKLPNKLEDYCDDDQVTEGKEKLRNGEPKAKKPRTQ